MGAITLKSHIDSLAFPAQLAELKKLMDGAQATITFWGNRVVTVDGYNESVYLDEIARIVIGASHHPVKQDDFTPAERISGLEIVEQLNDFYLKTDYDISCSNFLTWIFNFFIELSAGLYPPRVGVENETAKRFRTYSKEKFIEVFGYDEKAAESPVLRGHPHFGGAFGSPLQIMAKEESILALLA